VCVLTINSPIFEGPVSKALSGSDLTWVLGPIVAGALYYFLARDEVRASARVSTEHLEQALALSESVAIHEGLRPAEHPLRFESGEPAVEASDA
jgi:hypothetical protein